MSTDYFSTVFCNGIDEEELLIIFQELLKDEFLGDPTNTDEDVLDYVLSYDISDLKFYCLRDELDDILCFAEVQGTSLFGLNAITIYTPIKHRGMGYGKELASILLKNKLFDIWVVKPTNRISIALAESLGLLLLAEGKRAGKSLYNIFTR